MTWDMDHHEHTKPSGDDEYFERMSKVIFMAGLNWRILESKWPGIKKAFNGFDIKKVAAFKEPEIEELMMNPDVIRNLAKIRAVVANANTILDIQKQHGSFAKYLAALQKGGGEDLLRQDVKKRFAFLGDGTTAIFLFAVGEKLPKAKAEWEARHKH